MEFPSFLQRQIFLPHLHLSLCLLVRSCGNSGSYDIALFLLPLSAPGDVQSEGVWRRRGRGRAGRWPASPPGPAGRVAGSVGEKQGQGAVWPGTLDGLPCMCIQPL